MIYQTVSNSIIFCIFRYLTFYLFKFNNYEKILVPIDFSKQSEYASKMANRIAKKSNSSVYLLHLIELPTGIVDMGAGSNFSIPESMLYLRKVREQIITFKDRFFNKSLDIKYAIKFQNPNEGFKNTEKKLTQI